MHVLTRACAWSSQNAAPDNTLNSPVKAQRTPRKRHPVALSDVLRPNELKAPADKVFDKALVRCALICLMGENAYEAYGGDAGMHRMLHQRWEDGNTALALAAESNQGWILAALVRQGADPTATRADGLSPLMIAAAKGHTTCVTILAGMLRTPERINWANAQGHTALMYAAVNGRTECVAALVGILGEDVARSSGLHQAVGVLESPGATAHRGGD